MWVGGGQKNYGHPVPDASSHCEGTQRQEEEKHAWVMFGQFVRLGVPSCFTLCSKVNACECAAEQGEGGLGRGGMHVEMQAGNQYSAAQLTSHYIVTTPHLATFSPFQDLSCLKDINIFMKKYLSIDFHSGD